MDRLQEGLLFCVSTETERDAQRGCWLTTTPRGECVHTVGTSHKHVPTSPLLVMKATDPVTHEVRACRHSVSCCLNTKRCCFTLGAAVLLGQVMLNREDLVVSVRHPDGSLSVEHADGTRITSLFQKRPPNPPQHTDHTDDDREETGRRAEEGERACQERSACKNDGRSLSSTERVFLVEKDGCATVVMYPERHTAHVFLSDGTVITGDNKGSYEVRGEQIGSLRLKVQLPYSGGVVSAVFS